MKKKILFIVLLVLIFTVSISAIEPDDYGYYDITDDGKIEIIDVLGALKQVVNNEEGSGGILRVIRAIKLMTSAKVVTALITEMDAENATLLCEGGYITVPMQKIGFDKNYISEFYLTGTVTMTVSDGFVTSGNTKLLHAAAAACRYDINEVHIAADSITAIVNGTEQTLSANTIIKDGEIMVTADFLAEILEATVAWDASESSVTFEYCDSTLKMIVQDKTAVLNGNSVEMKVAAMIEDSIVYLPAAFVAEAFGAKATYYPENETLVIVKCFLPTFSISSASAKIGEEVALTLAVSHNPGVAGLQIYIEYDDGAFTYTSAKTVSNGMYAAATTTVGANPVKYVAANLSLKEVKGDLTLATVNFAVSDSAVAGDYDIILVGPQFYGSYNTEIYNMQAIVNSATITVTE